VIRLSHHTGRDYSAVVALIISRCARRRLRHSL